MQSNRYNLREMSIRRIVQGFMIRLKDIPQSLAWRFSDTAHWNRSLLRNYKDIHTGKRCIIVANGPSLAKMDLTILGNELTFGLNRIYLNFPFSSFRPTYYVAVNELVLKQFAHDITTLSMPKFVNWGQRSYFPKKEPGIIYLKSKHVINDTFEQDLTHPFVFGGTVTFVTLQLAFYMGFHQVVIIGLDHRFSENGTPNEIKKRTTEIDSSHFHPDYFPKGVKWQLPDLLRSEIDYSIARKFYESEGREILDATPGGNCNVFKKVDFTSILNGN